MNKSKIKKINAIEFDLSEAGLTHCVKCGSNKQKALVLSDMYYIQCDCGNWLSTMFWA